ncbi:MAG: GrpB family protein, partial [Prevotellaceae bacterium]|nr:GrpB family protein [Prevotellaceae bacterium]
MKNNELSVFSNAGKILYDMTLEELWILFPIIIVPYNPEWTAWYEEERNNLLTLLEKETVRISHIGSTAV